MPDDLHDELDEAEVLPLIFQFADGRCLRCQVPMTLEPGHATSVCADLVRPRAAGGLLTWDNVQALCQACTDLRAQALTRDV